MFGTNKNKDYEAIPDVEHGTLNSENHKAKPKVKVVDQASATHQAKQDQQYADLNLNDDQARLIGALDQAINIAGSHDDMMESLLPASSIVDDATTQLNDIQWEDKLRYYLQQAKEFVLAMLVPTLTAAITLGMAFYLKGQEEAKAEMMQIQMQAAGQADAATSYWTTTLLPILIQLFPYVNATLVFLSTVLPLQRRIMDSLVTPLFQTLTKAEETLQHEFGQLGPVVDETIDGIQQDFDIVTKPIQPTLDKLSGQAHLIEQILDKTPDNDDDDDEDDFNIPDPSDIDRQLDDAQGIVTDRMDQMQDQLSFRKYVPVYLQSPQKFYWRIVVPMLVLAWILQMAVAYASMGLNHLHPGATNKVVPSPTPSNTEHGGRLLFLRGSFPLMDDGSIASIIPSSATGGDVSLSRELNNKHSYESDPASTTENTDNIRDDARASYQDHKNQANHTLHAVQANVTKQLNDYKHTAKAEYQKYKEDALVQSKALVRSVLWSYAMAVLQMLLIYLVTNEAVRAWLVRQGIQQAQKGAVRTLEEHGVTDAMDEVFGTRLPRIRRKILKLVRIYKKGEQLLEQFGGVLPEGVADRLSDGKEAMQDAIEEVKSSKFFGRLFGK